MVPPPVMLFGPEGMTANQNRDLLGLANYLRISAMS